MRRLLLVAAAVLALLVVGGGTAKADLCASADCGPYAASLHWDVAPWGHTTTGYYVYLTGVQEGDVQSSPWVIGGMDCGSAFTLGVRPHDGSGNTGPMYTSVYTTPNCGGGSLTCDFTATSTATLNTDVSSATAGQTVCLDTASYGTWSGTNKAITVAAAPGQSPTMTDAFGTGTCCFTLQGMSGMSGDISKNAHDITIKDSTFSSAQTIDTSGSNIVFDGDTFPQFVGTARLWHLNIDASDPGTGTVTVQNSTFDNPGFAVPSGGADGVRCDSGTTNVLNNDISGIQDGNGANHGDPTQIVGGLCIIKGNYYHGMGDSSTCSLGEWDGGTNTVFENNVVDGSTGCYNGVSLYSDINGLVDHNVFFKAGCGAGYGSDCGSVDIGYKTGGTGCGSPAESPGSGTVIRDNIMIGGISNGQGCGFSSYGESYNLSGNSLTGDTHDTGPSTNDTIGTPKFVGGAHPTTYAGFQLCSNSPGVGNAHDGSNDGIQMASGSAC